MIKSLIQCRDEVFLLDHVSVKEIFIMKILGSSYLRSMLGWFSQFFETIKYHLERLLRMLAFLFKASHVRYSGQLFTQM